MITKDKLALVGADRLAEIIISLYENNKELQKQLNIIVAGLDQDPKQLISVLKKEITSLKRSTRFIDYYESSKFADSLNNLRLRIKEDLTLKSPTDAAVLMLSFLDLHKNTLNRVDDSNGWVGSAFRDACVDLGQIYAQLAKPIEEIVELIFNSFIKNNDYSIYNNIIFDFKESLQSEGLVLLENKIKAAQDVKNIRMITAALCDIADCQNNTDSYIAACRFSGKLSEYDHLEIAKRLIKSCRAAEALKWLDKAADLDLTHRWYDESTELRIEALELEGSYEKAERKRVEWFNRSLSPKLYTQIISQAKPEFKKIFIKSAIEKAFDFFDPYIAINFLIKIQALEECGMFVILKIGQLSGSSYYSLRPAAKILHQTNPLASILLYRKMAESVLEEAKSKYYNYAAQDLAQCTILSTKIIDWQEHESHDCYFNQVKESNKRKVSFWPKYDKALEKQIAKLKSMG